MALFESIKRFIDPEAITNKVNLLKEKDLRAYAIERIWSVFLKKNPRNNPHYHYTIHDPFLIFGNGSGYENFYLVGQNWIDNSDKPIAILLGCNDWKFGFIADYLPEFRVAFAPRKHFGLALSRSLSKLMPIPSAIVIWGYTDHHSYNSMLIERHAKTHHLDLYRMEDGFIRSAELGAKHSTPYSLVLDKVGIYYDCSRPSEIENLLNSYDFESNPDLLSQAEAIQKLITKFRLSKYNPATINQINSNNQIKLKKRVIVLGQVESDAAIYYGNPDNWKTLKLIQLARFENPDAEVLYRPHPEAYKVYKRNVVKRLRIESYANIISPEEPLINLFETVDHVYTITSLSGLEALIRGIKVTVVGLPFYAGWGLTDDRVTTPRRQRKLSLTELIAAIYLLYPRYLADLQDPYNGIVTACHKILADRQFDEHEKVEQLKGNRTHILLKKVETGFWPQLYFVDQIEQKTLDNLITKVDIISFLNNNPGKLFQTVFAFSILGKLKNENACDEFITIIRDYLDTDVLNDLLIQINEWRPAKYVKRHLSWLLGENEEYSQSIKVIECDIIEPVEGLSMPATNQGDARIEPEENEKPKIETINSKNLLQLFESLKLYGQYREAIDIVKILFLAGEGSSYLFLRVGQIAELMFDDHSARQIANLLQKTAFFAHNRGGLNLEIDNLSTNASSEKLEYIFSRLMLQLTTNPDRINKTWAIYKKFFNDSNYHTLLKRALKLDNRLTVNKALAYLEIDDLAKASEVIENIIQTGDITDKTYVAYSKILSLRGQPHEALKIIQKAINILPTHDNITELLRLQKSMGYFTEALETVNFALVRKIKITVEGHIMPILFGLKRIAEGFKCFHHSTLEEKLVKYYGKEKYHTNQLVKCDNLLLIFSSGPAEEIRFASMYKELARYLGTNTFKLTCDHRLYSLLKRSFPDIDFIPVKRARFFSPDHPREIYNHLPGADLINALDNKGHEAVLAADKIALLTDYLWIFRKNYKDFPGSPYLSVDKNRVKAFKSRLPKNTILVGLSWRSFLSNAMRNVHYLKIEQLEPIFNIPNVMFVNLQCDCTIDEFNWINSRFPGKLIHLEDLDQFNDFDGVAALLKCIDFLVTPNSAVSDLAGSIGCKGMIFSCHGELHWRKIDKTGTDVWFNSLIHVQEEFMKKDALVRKIKHQIEKMCLQINDNDKKEKSLNNNSELVEI